MVAQAVKLGGREYVILDRSRYERLVRGREVGGQARRRSAVTASEMPKIPTPDAKGLRPARQTLRAILARDIIKDRVALGWSQRELARRAHIRPETLSRIESGFHTPTVATI